jgi:hypothetical protein
MNGGPKSVEWITELAEYIEYLELQLRAAKYHIRRHINDFSPLERKCLMLDGLIQPDAPAGAGVKGSQPGKGKGKGGM